LYISESNDERKEKKRKEINNDMDVKMKKRRVKSRYSWVNNNLPKMIGKSVFEDFALQNEWIVSLSFFTSYTEEYENSSNYWYHGLIKYDYEKMDVDPDGNCLLYSLILWGTLTNNPNILKILDPAHMNLRKQLQKYIRENLDTTVMDFNFKDLLFQHKSPNTEPNFLIDFYDEDESYLELPHLFAFMKLYSVNSDVHVLGKYDIIPQKYFLDKEKETVRLAFQSKKKHYFYLKKKKEVFPLKIVV
jgi:hypothetical protein